MSQCKNVASTAIRDRASKANSGGSPRLTDGRRRIDQEQMLIRSRCKQHKQLHEDVTSRGLMLGH